MTPAAPRPTATREPDARPPDARRADARRNRETILASALELFARDPNASMSAIATAAGVGRVTLYGHFAGRDELVEAALATAVEQSDALLATLDLSGDPLDALTRLVGQSWRQVEANSAALDAALAALGEEHVRSSHDAVLTRVHELVERGQASGTFRGDLSAGWLTAVVYSTLHTACAEVAGGRLGPDEAEQAVVATVTSAVRG